MKEVEMLAMTQAMPSAHEDGAGKTAPVMIWRNGRPEQVEMVWGFEPFEPGARPVSLLRWEGREIEHPCLIIANEFGLKVDGRIKYWASLVTDAPFFCFAGVWRPATRTWPAAYAALTTETYPDIAPYKDRHIAVVREGDWMDWLQQTRPVSELLRPFTLGSFKVAGSGKRSTSGKPLRQATCSSSAEALLSFPHVQSLHHQGERGRDRSPVQGKDAS